MADTESKTTKCDVCALSIYPIWVREGERPASAECPTGCKFPEDWLDCDLLRSRFLSYIQLKAVEGVKPHPTTKALMQRLGVSEKEVAAYAQHCADALEARREILYSDGGVKVGDQSIADFCNSDPARMVAVIDAVLSGMSLVNGERNIAELERLTAFVRRGALSALDEFSHPDFAFDEE